MNNAMSTYHETLTPLYRAFNARDIDGALSQMQPEVIWANGMEGGYVHGHTGVRDYWTRQWRVIDPLAEPIRFHAESNRVVVDVHQVVRDLSGTVQLDQTARHIFTLNAGLVAKFEIG
jgi:hypothetical protein